MPRKTPYERLVGGIARTRKQVGKLSTRIASESEALSSIDRRLERLQQRLDSSADNDNDNVDGLLGDFKGIKRDLKEIKRRSKPAMMAMKEERRRERAFKKEERARKKVLLEEARLSALPEQSIRVIVDGWNVMGALLKGRGRSKSKMTSFLNEFAAHEFCSSREYRVSVMFDGGGRDGKDGLIFVRHSGTEEIVDDVLVKEFALLKERGIDCSDAMVVTSDRELTLRLHALGVLVMKSGTFVRLVRDIVSPPPREAGDDDDHKSDEVEDDGDIVMVNHDGGDQVADEGDESDSDDSSSESSDEE